MNPSNCNHTKMRERDTNKVVMSICPDCGFKASSSIEEVDEVNKEVLDEVERRERFEQE